MTAITDRERRTLAALATLRDTILRYAVKIPLPVLDELQEPMQRANGTIRAYREEMRAEIDAVNDNAGLNYWNRFTNAKTGQATGHPNLKK